MIRAHDLTGQTFGELVALHKAGNDPITRSPLWRCLCSCGVEKEIPSYALLAGHYRSCGCKHAAKRDAGLRKHIQRDSVNGTRKSALKSKLHKHNTSGVKGVRYVQSRAKWQAYIGVKGKNINLGYYDKLEDAVTARKTAEDKYHKPYIEQDMQKAPSES